MADRQAAAAATAMAAATTMAVTTTIGGGSNETNALSWAEVQEICGEMEKLYRKDAQKDAQRLRALVQKRRQIAATVESKQSESSKQLQHLLTNLKEWEEHDAAIKQRHEQMQKKVQELEALKREMRAQLERLRASLESLLEKYEETRLHVAQYALQHEHDIPFAKHQMSLYASVTGIKWDFSGASVAGDIIVSTKQLVKHFEIDAATPRFDAANAFWDEIDRAFDDTDKDKDSAL